jgi:hypothetical protein
MSEHLGHEPEPRAEPGATTRDSADAADDAPGNADRSAGAAEERPSAPDRHLTEHAAARMIMSVLENASAETEGRALIHDTAAHLLRGASDVDANIAAAVRGAVIGAIDAGPIIGLDRKDAAKAAAIGALEAAGEVGGQAAVEHVKRLVTGTINGVRPLDESLFPKGRRTP